MKLTHPNIMCPSTGTELFLQNLWFCKYFMSLSLWCSAFILWPASPTQSSKHGSIIPFSEKQFLIMSYLRFTEIAMTYNLALILALDSFIASVTCVIITHVSPVLNTEYLRSKRRVFMENNQPSSWSIW